MEIIAIEKSDFEKCKNFSEEVLKETYDRFKRSDKEREERIYLGKIGELVFLKYLNAMKIFPSTEGMFDIYKGETNVDQFDFLTKDGRKIDVKTAYKTFHKRILIPWDQFDRGRAKDYYVGVKIIIDKKEGHIYGFTTKERLLENKKINFGEGDAYWEYLEKLIDIDELLRKL